MHLGLVQILSHVLLSSNKIQRISFESLKGCCSFGKEVAIFVVIIHINLLISVLRDKEEWAIQETGRCKKREKKIRQSSILYFFFVKEWNTVLLISDIG